MEQGDAPFLSSGTWSLLGVKLATPITSPESRRANFTNEGGVGYIRYLKNIMGLWIIQCVQKHLGISFAQMVELAKTSTYTRIFDVNAARFSAPQDMRAEIRAALAETGEAPATDADLIKGKTIDEALKLTNKAVVEALEGLPPIKVHCSVLAEQAVKAALSDYYRRQGIDPEPIVGKLEEDCDHCESCGH